MSPHYFYYGIASDPLWVGGGITARGDAVRRPLVIVSFSILIPNVLSSFFSFCAHRLFHRGASLGGIASGLSLDEIRRSAGVPAGCAPAPSSSASLAGSRGDAVRRPSVSVSFSGLIPNALSSFVPPCALFFCAHRLFHRGASLEGIASDPLRAGGGIRQPAGAPAGYLDGGDGPGGIAPDRRIHCGPAVGSQPQGTRYVVPYL